MAVRAGKSRREKTRGSHHGVEAPAEGGGLAAMVRHRVPHDPVQQVDREQARIPEARFREQPIDHASARLQVSAAGPTPGALRYPQPLRASVILPVLRCGREPTSVAMPNG